MFTGHHHFQEKEILQNILRWWLVSGELLLITRFFFSSLTLPKQATSIQGWHTVDTKQGENKTIKSEGKAKNDIYDTFTQLMTQFICIRGVAKIFTHIFFIVKNNPVFFYNVLCY